MLFPWYTKYPYQNDEVLNLDWILKTIDNLVKEVANFVTLNTIKYADPIQWNITTQYEKNTVVIDPISGSAYISTKPVPAGVGLNNEDYWNIIFTLDVISANKNITLRDDANNMLATFESEVDDWLLWQGTLYIVTNSIEIGQAYVDGYNIKRYTVEMFLKDYITNLKNYVDTIIGSLDDLSTSDKDSIVDAINEIVDTIIGSLDDLSTSDKDSIVDAINEIVGIIGSLDDLSTSDKDSIVDSINEIFNNTATNANNIGDLDDLDTTDKDSLVDAINELVDNTDYIIVASKNGAVGDGITDDTAIIQSLINLSGSTGKPLFLDKTFKVTSLTITNGCEIFGTAGNTGYNKANIIASGNITIVRSSGNNTLLHNLTLQGNGTNFIINHAVNVKIRDCDIWHVGSGNCIISYGALLSITGCTFTCNDDYAIQLDIENTEVNINIYIDGNTFGGSCSLMNIKSSVAGYRPEGIVFSNNNTMNTGEKCFNISSVYSLIISGNTLDQIDSTVLFLNQATDVINDIQLINNYIGMVGSNPNPIVTIGAINNLTIRDNHWTGCQRIAILESNVSDVVISGNMLESDGVNYPAITVNNSKNVIITDNIIKKTGTNAIAIQAVNATGLSKVIIVGNIIKGTISLAGYSSSNSVNANNIAL